LPEGEPEQARALLEDWSRRHRPALLAYFRRRTPAGVDHEDLVQEVFQRLARRGDLHSVQAVEPYLFQTASSVLADFLRKRRLSVSTELLADDHADEGVSPEGALIGKEALEQLIVALDGLPERSRAIFSLYHFEDMTHRDIASRLGVSVSTIEKEMAKVNRHLLSALRSEL